MHLFLYSFAQGFIEIHLLHISPFLAFGETVVDVPSSRQQSGGPGQMTIRVKHQCCESFSGCLWHGPFKDSDAKNLLPEDVISTRKGNLIRNLGCAQVPLTSSLEPKSRDAES